MEFVRALADAWIRQLLALLLLPGAIAVLLYLLERATQTLLVRSLGWKAVIWSTGWLGTPVHELSHCLVSLVFAHRIHEVKLFEPDPEDGVLGYVRYSLPQSRALRPYAVAGQFFSGIAPLFGGALVLLLGLRFVAPGGMAVLDDAGSWADSIGRAPARDVIRGFLALVNGTYAALFSQGAASPRPWIFLYVALAVGAHLAPSPADLKGGLYGFLLLLGLLLVGDAVALALGASPLRSLGALARAGGAASALLTFALVLNLGNAAFAFVVSLIAGRRRRG